MKIAITGATGFVGRNLARALSYQGHELILIARGIDGRDRTVRRMHDARFAACPITDEDTLATLFQGCDAVAHCAGINRESGSQTFRTVHTIGTQAVMNAARKAQVNRVVLLSFLLARPDCGSAYHESKWQAEEIVRAAGIDYTVLKAGIIYGRGDHLVDHLAHSLYTIRLFASIGNRDHAVAPVAIEDLVRILRACLLEGRLKNETVSVLGPERLTFVEVVRRVARALEKNVLIFPMPLWIFGAAAWTMERVMKIPLISVAQVRMLTEGVADPLPGIHALPEDLAPRRRFTVEQIRHGLPDLRLCEEHK